MRCLYCGKDYWLPSQIRSDPDFCGAAHREKYNSLVERAMRCIQGTAPLPASEALPAPVMAVPAGRPASTGGSAGAGSDAGVHTASKARLESPKSAADGAAPAPSALPDSADSGLGGRVASGARLDKAPSQVNSALSHLRFREAPHIPQLAARPVFERLQAEVPRTANPAERKSAENPVESRETASPPMFNLLETGDGAARRKAVRFLVIAGAASVAVAGVLWVGAAAVRLGKDLRKAAPPETAAAAKSVSAPPPVVRPKSPSPHPSLAWLHSAAGAHAAVHLSESFETGMAAWGARSREWAPGWSHSPDGYVRPGQLALFQPTVGYSDYRMEFLGEIETKSLSWIVRGKDSRNYYAMKLTLTRPGLRPLLSLSHYPVLNGKAGHAVEVPLSVMTHNGVPYHVAVEVQGSDYRVWIEGEPVDAWSDDTLPAGAAGFFAEAGARSRIYWLTVSKNENWLGWLCARIVGMAEESQAGKKL